MRIPFLLARCELEDAIASGEESGFERARNWLRQVARMDPAFPPTPFLRGVIDQSSGRHEDAVDAFREALRRGYRPLVTRGKLAHALFLLGERLSGPEHVKPEPAIEVFEEAESRLGALKDDIRVPPNTRRGYRDLWIRAMVKLSTLLQESWSDPAAQKKLEKLIRVDPDDPRHHYELGLLFGKANRWETALREFRDALEIATDPNFVEPHLKIGEIHSQRGEPVEAERHFRLFFDVYPDEWFGHFYLGQHYQRSERYEEAVRSFIRCIELNPKRYASIAAVSACLRGMKRIPETEKWLFLYQALIAKTKVAPREARKAPREVLRRAEDLIARGEIETARQSLLRAHRAAPEDARVPFLLAQCELNEALTTGEASGYEKARNWLLKTGRLDPDFPPTPFLRGVIGQLSGRYEDAVDGFREALRRGYQPLASRGKLANALFLLGERLAGPEQLEPGPAIEVFEEAEMRFGALKDDVRVPPDARRGYRDLWIRTMVSLAALHREAGNHRWALKFLETLIRVDPADPRHHYDLGMLFDEADQVEPALRKYRDALEIARDPNFVEPHLKIGEIHSRRGESEEAERHLEIYFAVHPDDWLGHFHLGQHYRNAERYEEAVRSLLRCVELDRKRCASIAAVSACLRRLERIPEAEKWLALSRELESKAKGRKAPRDWERSPR